MILKREKMLKINKNKQTKKKTIEFGKDADLRISINWTVIRDNDVNGHRFESIIYILEMI